MNGLAVDFDVSPEPYSIDCLAMDLSMFLIG